MLKSGIGDTREVNQALLCEFKIREDVEMYIQFPVYDDFRGFGLSGETDLTAISKRICEGARRRHG